MEWHSSVRNIESSSIFLSHYKTKGESLIVAKRIKSFCDEEFVEKRIGGEG